MFTEQPAPFEVELCGRGDQARQIRGVAAVPDQLRRIDLDETRFLVMGGATESIASALREKYESGLSLAAALTLAVDALATPPLAANGAANRHDAS